jgi:toxin ParE1/3/4
VTLRLTLSPKAEADLLEIWDYTVERWSVTQAESYLGGPDKTLRLLCDYTDIARLHEEFVPPLRLHPYRSHLVIFVATDTALEVIRVVHMRTNWAAVLSE